MVDKMRSCKKGDLQVVAEGKCTPSLRQPVDPPFLHDLILSTITRHCLIYALTFDDF
jgi:hypothetical protein